MAKDEPVRMCIDRIVPDELAPARAAAEQAVAEEALRTMRAKLPDIDALDPSHPLSRLAIVTLKKWPNGSTLKCRFLDGGPKQRKRVEEKAHLWEKFTNIKFKFVKTSDEDIRISFEADPGSWSALGTDALVRSYFPKHEPTMNYGWLRDDTADTEYERVVVHEFGHALGAIHEHQSPRAGLKWNTAEVYRYFSGPPNYWSKEDIDFNVLQRYAKTQVNATKFDPKSIMLYAFDGSLFKDGKGTHENDRLSAADKRFIAEMYPKS
jgi:serralysin